MSPDRWWHAKDHPVWGTLHMIAIVGCALAFGYANSSSFDSGEVITALGSAGAARLILGKRTTP